MDITSYILGKKAGGGSPAPVLQDKEVEITQNGETTITADSGYDGLSSVDITTNVPSQKYAPGFLFQFSFRNFTGTDLSNETKNIIITSSAISSLSYAFGSCSNITNLDISSWNGTFSSMTGMVSACSSLLEVDMKNINCNGDASYLFSGSILLEKIDIRSMEFNQLTSSAGMFGAESKPATHVPANCLIIVKDATQKQWLNTNFPRMTNVKTVAEYEG